jgi:hypothetical protein
MSDVQEGRNSATSASSDLGAIAPAPRKCVADNSVVRKSKEVLETEKNYQRLSEKGMDLLKVLQAVDDKINKLQENNKHTNHAADSSHTKQDSKAGDGNKAALHPKPPKQEQHNINVHNHVDNILHHDGESKNNRESPAEFKLQSSILHSNAHDDPNSAQHNLREQLEDSFQKSLVKQIEANEHAIDISPLEMENRQQAAIFASAISGWSFVIGFFSYVSEGTTYTTANAWNPNAAAHLFLYVLPMVAIFLTAIWVCEAFGYLFSFSIVFKRSPEISSGDAFAAELQISQICAFLMLTKIMKID